MTSPTSLAPATPPASRPRLHWSVAAPLSAAVGVGSAVLGVLVDLPLLGLAGAVVAAVPAVLASRRVPALQAEVARTRAATPADPAPAPAPVAPGTVDLVRAERPARVAAPAVDLVKAPRPQHAAVGAARATSTAATALAGPAAATAEDARVDTAELQLIWDLGEASRSRSGHGRRARTGAEVDALPDRPRNVSSPRRRARHRA